jgi:hypothetical protein
MGNVFAFMTGSAVEISPEDENGGVELNGWIDQSWSMTHLHDSRNDVRPLMNLDETDYEGLVDEIRDILGNGEMWEDNGDGSFYSKGSRTEDGMEYTYAVHFKLKSHSESGWIETDWHPERDGGISLSE